MEERVLYKTNTNPESIIYTYIIGIKFIHLSDCTETRVYTPVLYFINIRINSTVEYIIYSRYRSKVIVYNILCRLCAYGKYAFMVMRNAPCTK